MDTTEFFDAVLPRSGQRCLVLKGADDTRQRFGDTNTWAAKVALAADALPVEVYHACASFEGGKRKATNAVAARAFWVDLDVGEGKPYAKQSEAVLALKAFCNKLEVPVPLVVNSGWGIHAYWPLTEDLAPDAWLATATLLKAAAKACGLHADPSRTADIASILRPPGTHNKKREPKEVKVLGGVRPIEHAIIHERLKAWLGDMAPDDPLSARPAHISGELANADLAGGLNYAPSFANRIADNCAVMALMRDPPDGKLDQPTWYHGLQVLGGCVDGWQAAHDWSKKDPRYKPGETQENFERASSHKPTLCEKLGEHHPTLCASCKFNGKIRSPITLGQDRAAVVEVPVDIPKPNGMTFGGKQITEDADEKFPWGFNWGHVNGCPRPQLFRVVKAVVDGEEEVKHVAFCDTLFYPISRLAEDHGAGMEIEMVVRGDEKRRFSIPTSIVGEGGSKLYAALAAQEIVALPNMKSNIDHYLSGWVTKLKEEAEATQTYHHFGWHGRDFLVGDTLVTPDGDRQALVGGNAAYKASAFQPQGSLQVWKETIEAIYNHPGQEAYQFMVLLSFAAPLLPMLRQYGGVTAYAHSEGSGVGKTTAQRAGLSAFGNWADLQLADGKTTQNALWALIGTYNSLAVMYDELTNQANNVASDFVLSVSSGRAKDRLSASGTLRANNANWSTIVMASGNNLLSEKVSLHRGNAEAEISRLFEFTVASNSPLSPNEAAILFPRLLDNYGHAGLEYLHHVVANYDAVSKMLESVQQSINDEAGIQQAERYWSALLSCVLTALVLCRQLGLVGFNGRALKSWMLAELENNREHRQDAVSDPIELFGKMMAELWQGVLITIGEGDLRSARSVATVLGQGPRGALTGRCVVPPADKNTNVRAMLAINAQAARTWCNKNGVSAREMFDALVAKGWARPEQQRYLLGRGVPQYSSVTSPVRCWFIDPVVAGLDVGGFSMASIVREVATGTDD